MPIFQRNIASFILIWLMRCQIHFIIDFSKMDKNTEEQKVWIVGNCVI